MFLHNTPFHTDRNCIRQYCYIYIHNLFLFLSSFFVLSTFITSPMLGRMGNLSLCDIVECVITYYYVLRNKL